MLFLITILFLLRLLDHSVTKFHKFEENRYVKSIESKVRWTYRKFQDRNKDSRAMLYLTYNIVNAILGSCMLHIENK